MPRLALMLSWPAQPTTTPEPGDQDELDRGSCPAIDPTISIQ
jgi:hypothetical protein